MSLATPRKGYKSVPWLFGKEIEIPDEWDFETMEIITSQITYGLTVRPKFVEKGIPLISAREIRTGKINFLDAPKISKEDFSNLSNKCKGTNNDLFFSKTGTIGYVAKVETLEDFAISQNIASLSPKSNKIISEFFEWVLHSNYFRKSCFRTINTTTIMDLQLGELGKINVCVPPLPEQQKIATILSNVDNLIESTVQVIAHSKKVKNGLMQKLLTRGIGHTRFKKVSWLFGKEIEIPEEWEVKKMHEVSTLNAGGTPSRSQKDYWENGIIPWLSSGEIKNNIISESIEHITQLGLDNSSARLFKKGTVLLAITGFGMTRGRTSLLDFESTTNQSVIGITSKNVFLAGEFLWHYLQKQYWVLRSFSQGSQQPGLNLDIVKNFKIILPKSTSEQQKIASILSNIDSKITSQEQYKEKLEKLKKSLMQKLLTGEVRV